MLIGMRSLIVAIGKTGTQRKRKNMTMKQKTKQNQRKYQEVIWYHLPFTFSILGCILMVDGFV